MPGPTQYQYQTYQDKPKGAPVYWKPNQRGVMETLEQNPVTVDVALGVLFPGPVLGWKAAQRAYWNSDEYKANKTPYTPPPVATISPEHYQATVSPYSDPQLTVSMLQFDNADAKSAQMNQWREARRQSGSLSYSALYQKHLQWKQQNGVE
jgi:hypothetical protein